MPAVVWIHGGGWMQGSYNDTQSRHLALAARGYVVASIEHRFSGEAVFPAAIEDCKLAVRFLRAHAKDYNIDADHIGAIGASSGAHLAELLGTSGSIKELEGKGGWPEQSSKVQAVVAYAGMTELMRFGSGSGRDMTTKFLGGPVTDKKALAELASPLTHVSKDSPPFLIIHGEKDTTVPIINAQLLTDALKKAGVEVEMVVVKGGGHNIVPPVHDAKVNEFLDKHLKK
jgi:acetyl esterase/lipase